MADPIIRDRDRDRVKHGAGREMREENEDIYHNKLDRTMENVVSLIFGDLSQEYAPPTWKLGVGEGGLPKGGFLTTVPTPKITNKKIAEVVCEDRNRVYSKEHETCMDRKSGDRESESKNEDGWTPDEHLNQIIRHRNRVMDSMVHSADSSTAYSDYLIVSKNPGGHYVRKVMNELYDRNKFVMMSIEHPLTEWVRKSGKNTFLQGQEDFQISVRVLSKRMEIIANGSKPEGIEIGTNEITDHLMMRGKAAYINALQDPEGYWMQKQTITRKTIKTFREHLWSRSDIGIEIANWLDILVSKYMLIVEYVPFDEMIELSKQYALELEEYQQNKSKFVNQKKNRKNGNRKKVAIPSPVRRPENPEFIGKFVVKQTVLSLLHFYNVQAVVSILLTGKNSVQLHQEEMKVKTEEEHGFLAPFFWKAFFPNGFENGLRSSIYNPAVDRSRLSVYSYQPNVSKLPELAPEWMESRSIPLMRATRRHSKKKSYDVFGGDVWLSGSNEGYHSIHVPTDAKSAKLDIHVMLSMHVAWLSRTFGLEKQYSKLMHTIGKNSQNPFDSVYPACTDRSPCLSIEIPLDTQYYQNEESGEIARVDPSVGREVTFTYFVDSKVEFMYNVVAAPHVKRKKEVRIYGLRFFVESSVTQIALASLSEMEMEKSEFREEEEIQAIAIAKQLFETAA